MQIRYAQREVVVPVNYDDAKLEKKKIVEVFPEQEVTNKKVSNYKVREQHSITAHDLANHEGEYNALALVYNYYYM